jgi:serine phosphatase RsbU (regulator of sigma subunit)
MLARLKISVGIRLLLILGVLSLLALSGIGLWTLRSQMLEDRQAELRKLMDLTLSVARAAMTKAGGPASEAGSKAFYEVIQTARFGRDQNYVFAMDYDGVIKVHANSKILGKNLWDFVQVDERQRQEYNRITKSPEVSGFVKYTFGKGASGQPAAKLSLIQNVAEIKGLIGVGLYIDDVDADTYRQLYVEGAMLAAILGTMGAAAFLISRTVLSMTSEMDEQLAAAAALQRDMLPSPERIAQTQSRCSLDLSSYYKPRNGIGGDIWGIEPISAQRVMIYVADFTGHGVSAALNTARFHSFLHMELPRADRPASLLNKLNERLRAVLPVGQFATMSCATIDFEKQTLEFASAGAPPQLYRTSSETAYEVFSHRSLPLGVLSNADYESQTVAFRAGGDLVLYTDGFVETPKPPHSVFTTDSLRQFLNKTGQASSEQLRQSLLGEVSKPAVKADDDITLVIARHSGGAIEPLNYHEIEAVDIASRHPELVEG